MAYVTGHLSVAALEERYEACEDVMSSRHFQTIWLLAKGHSTGEVAAMTSFGRRWIEQLLERYNAFGPSALGDLRRGNGAPAKVLTAELLQRLRIRLGEPPPDGGVWTSGKVARWMAGELGLASLAPQRGWEALRAIAWSIQKPRPRNPKAATPAEQEAFKKKSPKSSPRRPRSTPIRRSRLLRPTNTGSA
jgi:transposase